MDWLLQRARALSRQLGPGGTFAVRTALSLLVPGGGILADLLSNLLDLARDSATEADEAELRARMAELGDELHRVNGVLDVMEGRLGPTLKAAAALQPEAIESYLVQALASDPGMLEARAALQELCAGTKLLQQGQEQLLARVDAGIDLTQDLRELVDGTLVYFRAAEAEGVQAADAPRFVLAQRDFLAAIRAGDLAAATKALGRIEELAPESATAWVYRAAIAALDGQVDKAAHDAATAARRDPGSALLRRATRAASRATRSVAGRKGSGPGLEPGQVLGSKRWKLGRLLGQGGQGQVWLATNARGKQGALKVLRGETETSRLIGEMEALEAVQHPGVVELLDWGLEPQPFLVCRYVEGASLSTRLRRDGPLQPGDACRIFSALAQGLAACHDAGLIHRDIKPSNVLLDRRGDPVLIDFGIARRAEAGEQTQLNPHTMAFAAPEQLRGLPATPKSDVFSLAATLAWSMAPAEGPALPQDLLDELPDDFQRLLEPALHTSARRRKVAARDFADGLKALHARRLATELRTRQEEAQASRRATEAARRKQEEERRAVEAATRAEEEKRREAERQAQLDARRAAERRRVRETARAKAEQAKVLQEFEDLRIEKQRREERAAEQAAMDQVLASNMEEVQRWEDAADLHETREELGLEPDNPPNWAAIGLIAGVFAAVLVLLSLLGSC